MSVQRLPQPTEDPVVSVTVTSEACSDVHSQPGFVRTRLKRALVPTWFAYAAYIIARKPFSVTRSVVEREVGLSPMMSGMVDTAFLVTYSVGQILYSLVRQYCSTRTVISLGLSGAAACCLLFAYVPLPWVMVVAWGMNGVFESFGWPSCVSVVTPWLGQKERGKVMGVWGSNQAVGSLLGNWLSATLLHQLGWQGVFAGCFVPVFGTGALLFLTLHEHPNRSGLVSPLQWEEGVRPDTLRHSISLSADGEYTDAGVTKQAQGQQQTEAPASLSTRQLAALPGVLDMSISYFCQKLVRYSLLFWLPYFLSKQLGYTPVLAGYVSSAFDFGGVAGSMASGVLSDAYHGGTRRAAVCCMYLLCGIGSLMLFSWAQDQMRQSVPLTVVVSAAVGFFFFGCDSLMTGATIQDLAGRLQVSQHAGAISGFVGGIGSIGAILQGVTTAYLATNYGWASVFYFLIALSCGAAAMMVRPMRLERAPPKYPDSP